MAAIWAPAFAEFVDLFESTLRSAKGQGAIVSDLSLDDYFRSAEHADFKMKAEPVFECLRPVCQTFLSIVLGLEEGAALGNPELGRGLCFPRRFLKADSVEAIAPKSSEVLVQIIPSTFYLGLSWYLMTITFPTRDRVDRVDCDRLARQWATEALVADIMLKKAEQRPLPFLLFDYYWRFSVEPQMKGTVPGGFLGVGRYRSFFLNLFAAGGLLGSRFDGQTQA